MAKIKVELEQLIEALNASLTTRCKDEAGDYRIVGRKGHIYAQPEGFYIHHEAGSSRAWTFAKREFANFTALVLDGDDEGVFLMRELPAFEEAEIIRDRLGIRKRKVLSDKERERLKTSFKGRSKQLKLPFDGEEA